MNKAAQRLIACLVQWPNVTGEDSETPQGTPTFSAARPLHELKRSQREGDKGCSPLPFTKTPGIQDSIKELCDPGV